MYKNPTINPIINLFFEIKSLFSRTSLWRLADFLGILSFFGFTIWWIFAVIGISNLSNKIDIVEQKIDWNTAYSTIMMYFSDIENNNLTWAYNLLSDSFKKDKTFNWFSNRLNDIVWFEWLKITELTWKNTVTQKVFIVEFWFKKRWKIPLESKWWMYVKFNNWKREINANSVLYENERNSTACKFYKFDHCK